VSAFFDDSSRPVFTAENRPAVLPVPYGCRVCAQLLRRLVNRESKSPTLRFQTLRDGPLLCGCWVVSEEGQDRRIHARTRLRPVLLPKQQRPQIDSELFGNVLLKQT